MRIAVALVVAATLPACDKRSGEASARPVASASTAASTSASAATSTSAVASASAAAGPPRPPPPPPLEPARAEAQHLMSCLSDAEPTICPWWESMLDVPTTRRAKRDCEGGEKLACLVEGLGAIGRGEATEAADALVRSCDEGEALACVYLAYTHLVCSRNAMRGGAACTERLENHFDDKKSETVLVRGCDEGLGSACYVLGKILWARTDNEFPWLERGCRFSNVGACSMLYDELRDVTKQPSPSPRRLGWVRIRLMELCDASQVDCFDIARDLSEMTHMPAREFLDRACNPKRAPHMPGARCKEAARGPGPGVPSHDR